MNLVCLILLFNIKGSFGMSKIIGGKAATEFKYPYVVCIKYWNFFKGRHFTCRCGGTLIKEDIIVTAAHCFFNDDKEKFWPSSLRAYGGTVDLHHDQEYHVGQAITPHPKYSTSVSLQYDCGVMKIKSGFKLNLGNIGYEIEIYQFDFTSLRKITNDMIRNKEECWSIGWGAQENKYGVSENFSLVLNEIKTNLLGYDRCEYESYSIRRPKAFTLEKKGVLCTKDRTGMNKSTCIGDSGSPIICDCVVLGVLSGGPTAACGQDNTPSFYTRIDYVEDFLKPFFLGKVDTVKSRASSLVSQVNSVLKPSNVISIILLTKNKNIFYY